MSEGDKTRINGTKGELINALQDGTIDQIKDLTDKLTE